MTNFENTVPVYPRKINNFERQMKKGRKAKTLDKDTNNLRLPSNKLKLINKTL
jgi:hypothetical protein